VSLSRINIANSITYIMEFIHQNGTACFVELMWPEMIGVVEVLASTT
jgi:hypothetical protein